MLGVVREEDHIVEYGRRENGGELRQYALEGEGAGSLEVSCSGKTDAYRLQRLYCLRALLRQYAKQEDGKVVRGCDKRAGRERQSLAEVKVS